MFESEGLLDADARVEAFAREADLGWVARALTARRAEILERWLLAAGSQPFHRSQPERVVADHVPELLDALIDLLRRHAPRPVEPAAPLEDPAVAAAAQGHARTRAEQGLEPPDVVVEFRLLRQEILRALRQELPAGAPVDDVLGATLLVHDALDGTITVGLAALTERIDAMREDFLAVTVHEVRRPLTVIRAGAQQLARLARRPDRDPDRIAGEAGRIVEQTERMAAQLSQLLDVSRSVLGDLAPERRPLDLVALLRESVAELGPEAGRVTLEVAAGTDATGVWDPGQLHRVAANLLSNAIKYSPPGTPIEIALRGAGPEVEFSVRDHGSGIAPQDLPNVFRRYFRTRRAAESGVEGLGLGLYLCRGIVEAHGGRVRAESAGHDLGTTIRVVLPRQDPSAR